MLICPICKNELKKRGNSLFCSKNHCFDFAKQGYINLLPVQQKKSLNPGDSKEMLSARRSFLSKGFYTPIKDKVACLIETYRQDNENFLDIGCGEGYYTVEISRAVPFKNVIGTDIAKCAVTAVKILCGQLQQPPTFLLKTKALTV